uniref:Polygalacturonase non-catalytic subunit AroGP3 n=2 Tax=Lygus hesperus TaxID=30085 RepID=A0A0A9WV36_LYGHE
MTEVFYVAVKGSLHSGDSSVFGIKSEEYSALCRRFPDSNKQVINGVLIKGSPLEVINSLAELGYRVTCSSGETEIVWTLRREALVEKLVSPTSTSQATPLLQPREKRVSPVLAPQATAPLQPGENFVSPYTASQATPPSQQADTVAYPITSPQPPTPLPVIGRPFVVQPPMTRAPVKTVERIGTKPEDWQDMPEVPDRITAKHISSLEKIDPGQKIILKTNLSSEFNPLSKRPGPTLNDDCSSVRRRSISMPPLSNQNPRTSGSNKSSSESPGPRGIVTRTPLPLSPRRPLTQPCGCTSDCHCKRHSKCNSLQPCKSSQDCGPSCTAVDENMNRKSMTIYLEDLISPDNLDLDTRPKLKIPSEIYTCLFMYKPGTLTDSEHAADSKPNPNDDSIMVHEKIYEVRNVTVVEKKPTIEVEHQIHFSPEIHAQSPSPMSVDVNVESFSVKSVNNMCRRPENPNRSSKPSNTKFSLSDPSKHLYSCRYFTDPGKWAARRESTSPLGSFESPPRSSMTDDFNGVDNNGTKCRERSYNRTSSRKSKWSTHTQPIDGSCCRGPGESVRGPSGSFKSHGGCWGRGESVKGPSGSFRSHGEGGRGPSGSFRSHGEGGRGPNGSFRSHGESVRGPNRCCRGSVESDRGPGECHRGPCTNSRDVERCGHSPSPSPVRSIGSPLRESITDDFDGDNNRAKARGSTDTRSTRSNSSPLRSKSPASEDDTLSRNSYTSDNGSPPPSKEVYYVDVHYGGDDVIRSIGESTTSPNSMSNVQKRGTKSISDDHRESSIRSFQNSRSYQGGKLASQSLMHSCSSTPGSTMSAPNLLL